VVQVEEDFSGTPRAVVGHLAETRNRYLEYLALVGDATFVDISRKTDPGRSGQPWQALSFIAETYGFPKVVQIWTKGPRDVLRRGRPLLERLRREGTTMMCQHSATGLGPEIEPHVSWPIDWTGVAEMIDFLGTPDAMLWRYDPIIPGWSKLETFNYMAENFSRLGVTSACYNRGECGLQLVRGRLGEQEHQVDQTVDMNAFSRSIEEIGRSWGIEFTTLAEGEQLDGELNMISRCCTQYDWLARVSDGFPLRDFLPGSKRAGCICAPSFDVGIEGQFGACYGCAYCFAP
jgi:hypothetical protein